MGILTALYLLAVIFICILFRGKGIGLVIAVIVSWTVLIIRQWKEMGTYAGDWYVTVWSLVLGVLCLIIWAGANLIFVAFCRKQ